MSYLKLYFMEFSLNPHYMEQATAPGYARINMAPHPTCCVPTDHGGDHWLFVVPNPKLKQVQQYNLLPMASSRDYTQDISQKLMQLQGKNWSGEQVSTTWQPNLYNCGLYTLAKIYCLVNNPGHTQGTPSWQSLIDNLMYATPMPTLYATAPGQHLTPESLSLDVRHHPHGPQPPQVEPVYIHSSILYNKPSLGSQVA